MQVLVVLVRLVAVKSAGLLMGTFIKVRVGVGVLLFQGAGGHLLSIFSPELATIMTTDSHRLVVQSATVQRQI